MLFPLYYVGVMTKRIPSHYDPTKLIEAISKWSNPMFDKKHNLYIYVEGRARSNQTRVEHIVEYGHDLKVRDLESVPEGIKNYFAYKKDPVYPNTYNYYIDRKGQDKGFIKVSIRISDDDPTYAWVKTIFIAYHIK